ncbi:uncharacterized protein LOC109705200 [Ananas comosus]|uniref:RNA-directed DNA polymerase n=1 Tax=Ananas comosus TaxID=4615 RepID=A0A6P5EJD6_ANACO|nr:uncharacterized protein LOC109705200 [Ananas comosus]
MDVGYLNSEKVVIQGFNQHSQKALGSITLPIRFGKLQTEAKFYVINADTSYKALLGRPWLHKYHIVPSTLHQCLKYIKDGEEYRIDGDIRPFGVHEIRYEDARYFIELEDTEENRSISREQSSKEKKLVDEIKRESTVPYFGSDSDSSNLDEDELCWAMKLLSNNWNTLEVENSSEDEHHFTAYVRADRMIAKASDLVEDTLTILKVPEECHRLIPARQVSVVDHLKTFFVPPKIEDVEGRRTVKRGILFYKSDDKKSTDVIRPEDYDDDIYEDIEIPNYFSASLIKMIHKLGCPTRRSWANHKFFERMWNPPQRRSTLPNGKSSNTRGLGYYRSSTYQDIYTCNVINANADIAEHLVDEQKSLEPKDAPQELEDGGQATVDELLEINLGTEEDPRPTYISALLPEEEQEKLKTLLTEFKDCFAWSYKEMPGLNPEVAVHKLAIDSQAHPVKQAPRRMRVDLEEQIIAETKKLIEAGFIREEKYANWIASIVPVKKKNGQIRICVDFRDLNKACPKDDFPLPITELMIDNTSSCELFSFMDGSSGYNQIKMAPEDEKHTAFRTPIGIYCYKVMPFGLKNAGATYQRAMTRIFDDLLHKTVECYVDDLVVKTKNKENHFQDLTTVFTRLREHQLKMNPLKCAFGVVSGKFLGFIVRHRGVEIDPSKIKAIVEMPPPKNLKQLRSFQGRLAYIRRFISNLSGRVKPFSKLVKKDAPFVWDTECQTAFEGIKEYVMSPPVLAALIHGKPLILYTAALDGSLGALLAQNNEEGKEQALYYLSRMLEGAENSYSQIEKHCLALIFAVKKLRHYMLEHKIYLVSKVNPLKFLMTRPVLTGRLAKWTVILLEFDITYTPQKAVKGQALADFLAAHPVSSGSLLVCDLPDEEVLLVEDEQPYWDMYFDGASSIQPAYSPSIPQVRVGVGLIFVTPERGILRYSLALSEPRTNNEAEYEALIAGLEIAIFMNIQRLHIYGDSQLIINQVTGEYKVHKPELTKYQKRAQELMKEIPNVTLERVSRAVNGKADALARLAKELADPNLDEVHVTIKNRMILSPTDLDLKEESKEIQKANALKIEVEDYWREPYLNYFKHNELPEEKPKQVQLKKRAMRYAFVNDTPYRRSYDQLWLRCISPEETKQVMHEVHSGVCGAHQSGPKIRLKIKRLSYY